MRLARVLAALAMLALAACAHENKNEQLANRITTAVMANDVSGVAALFSPRAHITRMEVAQYAYELNAQGALKSIAQTHPCDSGAGWMCFDVIFAQRIYREHMRVNKDGLITDWYFHIATTPLPTPDPT